MRHLFPAPPQPRVERQTKVSFASTRASRKRAGSSAGSAPAARCSSVKRAMPSAPTVPGFGGMMTSQPVWRATAAARAGAANGMPWQKTTCPTLRLPFTRLR